MEYSADVDVDSECEHEARRQDAGGKEARRR